MRLNERFSHSEIILFDSVIKDIITKQNIQNFGLLQKLLDSYKKNQYASAFTIIAKVKPEWSNEVVIRFSNYFTQSVLFVLTMIVDELNESGTFTPNSKSITIKINGEREVMLKRMSYYNSNLVKSPVDYRNIVLNSQEWRANLLCGLKKIHSYVFFEDNNGNFWPFENINSISFPYEKSIYDGGKKILTTFIKEIVF